MAIKRLAALVTAIGALSVGGWAAAGPAAAGDYYHCPAKYFCTYAGNDGQGYPNMELKDTNPNWNDFGGVGKDGSALNWGTSGLGVTVYEKWGNYDYCVPWHLAVANAGHVGGSNFWNNNC